MPSGNIQLKVPFRFKVAVSTDVVSRAGRKVKTDWEA